MCLAIVLPPALACVVGWNLQTIDAVTARTTIRLWHELHVQHKVPHDFASLLAPETDSVDTRYWAAVRHQEIRSIIKCTATVDALEPSLLAHAPHQTNAGTALILLLREEHTHVRWSRMKDQPRWFLEGLALE